MYYKVVLRLPDKRLVSVEEDNQLRLEYQVGEWTRPRVGCLFVFTDLTQARRFLHGLRGAELWSCQIGQEVDCPVLLTDPFHHPNIMEWWQSGAAPDPRYELEALAAGTVCVDAVRLVHKIW